MTYNYQLLEMVGRDRRDSLLREAVQERLAAQLGSGIQASSGSGEVRERRHWLPALRLRLANQAG